MRGPSPGELRDRWQQAKSRKYKDLPGRCFVADCPEGGPSNLGTFVNIGRMLRNGFGHAHIRNRFGPGSETLWRCADG
jgi:hypothetical protein